MVLFTNQSAGPIYIIKGNKPVVKFIRNCIRDSSEEFPIFSLLRILKTSFRLFVQTVSFPSCLRYEFHFRSHGSNQYFTHSLRLLVKFYFSQPEKKSISWRRRLVLSFSLPYRQSLCNEITKP